MSVVMRAFTGTPGAILLSALLCTTCSGSPPILRGELTYSDRCISENVCSSVPDVTEKLSGADGQGTVPLHVSCYYLPLSSGSMRISVGIGRGEPRTTEERSLKICGDAMGTGDLRNGLVTYRSNGFESVSPAAGASCQVRINSLKTDGVPYQISGQLQCMNLRDDNAGPNPRVHTIAGSVGTPQTMDPQWADFSFTGCTQDALRPCS